MFIILIMVVVLIGLHVIVKTYVIQRQKKVNLKAQLKIYFNSQLDLSITGKIDFTESKNKAMKSQT